MLWAEIAKAKLATDEDTESQFLVQNTQRNPQKNVGTVTPNITAQRKNCAWSISKCVGNVESCQILWSIMLQQKKVDARKFVPAVDYPDIDPEMFHVDHISAVDLDDSQLVTLKL